MKFQSKGANRIGMVIWTALIAAILSPVSLQACPGCSAALDATVGRGFNLSILFLMTMPFLVLAGILGGLVFINRYTKETTLPPQIIENNQREENKIEPSYDN